MLLKQTSNSDSFLPGKSAFRRVLGLYTDD